MTPTYRAPLAIRFENLSAFIKQQIALADEKDAGRQTDSEMEKVESLRRLSNLLDLRPKYNPKSVKRAIESVVQRYEPERDKQPWKQYTFAALHDRCRTAVVAIASNGSTTQPHLFRTYDHNSSDHPAPFLRNLGGADSAPIWEVARATSACPYYFENATFGGQTFRDGGGAGFNNPSLEAFAEVNAIHRWRQEYAEKFSKHHDTLELEDLRQHSTQTHIQHAADKKQELQDAIALFISIGSCNRPLPAHRASKTPPRLNTLAGIHQTATSTYTQRTHEEMARVTWGTDTAYYRLHVVGESTGSMEIDEWGKGTVAGKRVNTTLERIERETGRYLEDAETKECIRACAEKLVAQRRAQL